VLDGDPTPSPKSGGTPIFGPRLLWPNDCMDQDATWYGGWPRSTRHCARWGRSSPPQFSANVRCGQTAGWTKMPLGMEVGIGPGNCVRWGPSYPQKKGHTHRTIAAHVYCGQTAGWMKTPFGTEVDLGPGHIVLDGVPALRERGTATPLFSAHVYCGHGYCWALVKNS